MESQEIIRTVHYLQNEGWKADKILHFLLVVLGDRPAKNMVLDLDLEGIE